MAQWLRVGSKQELQSELHLPRGARSSQFPRIRAVIRRVQSPEIRVIDQVEKLAPELNSRSFRNRKVLEDGEINPNVPGTCQRVAPDVAELAFPRIRKRRRIEPLLTARPARRRD